MDHDAAKIYISTLYKHLMKRTPESGEFTYWTKIASESPNPEDILYAFLRSSEYLGKTRVHTVFPPGHYYSPVVDPATVGDYVKREQTTPVKGLDPITVELEDMEAFWRRQAETIKATPFQDAKNDQHRFYYDNNIFSYGDAISLRAMISDLKPKNIVEIGSGFSSACMLDSVDEFKLSTEMTFIDPHTERLESMLRKNDLERVTIVRDAVQNTSLDIFQKLGRGDILFIDSTHVLKTGSDVHYELFHILPNIAPGVFIHFHDIHFPFEYIGKWIFELNHSWNEIYALRAFLMYNGAFKIRFWGSCLAQVRNSLIREISSTFLKNPGGSIWIEKMM